jgi:hypothetical protein
MASGNGHGFGSGDRLDSWKAIAAYLGRDAGTVRRWERTRGLPVHRVPGGKGSSVFAFTGEIDAWLKSAPQESAAQEQSPAESPTPAELAPAPRRSAARWWWPVAGIALAGAIVLGWSMTRTSASVADIKVTVTESELTARDSDNSVMWRHRLDERFRHIPSSNSEASRVIAAGHPGVYFLTSYRARRDDNNNESGELTALDPQGDVRWTFRFDDVLTIGGKPFAAPWANTAFSIDDSTSTRKIAVAAHHYLWGPSLVTILDDSGRRHGTFVNDGWIEQTQWLSPSRLAIGGFSESHNGGMVALIDPSALDGQTPEAPGSRHVCQNCGVNPPVRMAVMPRTELNLATLSRFNRAILQRTNDRLIVRTVEVPGDGSAIGEAIYEFSHSLDFITASFSQAYWDIHQELYAQKKIDHDRAHCADRDGPRLLHAWSPDGGWRIQSIR